MTQPALPPRDGQPDASQTPPLAPSREAGHHLLVQAPVAPMDADGLSVTILGLVAFAIGTGITALFYAELASQGKGWWLGVCLCGFGLGLIGLGYCLFRRGRRRDGRWQRD